MQAFARRLSLAFAAGAVGGVASSFALWLLGASGLAHALDVRLAPAWLVPRAVWGGLFGLLFLLPLASQRWVAQGLALSLVPSLFQLVARLPEAADAPVVGREPAAAVALLLVNAAWGLAAAAWLHATGR